MRIERHHSPRGVVRFAKPENWQGKAQLINTSLAFHFFPFGNKSERARKLPTAGFRQGIDWMNVCSSGAESCALSESRSGALPATTIVRAVRLQCVDRSLGDHCATRRVRVSSAKQTRPQGRLLSQCI